MKRARSLRNFARVGNTLRGNPVTRGETVGWLRGFEPPTTGITIQYSNQLSYSHQRTLSARDAIRCDGPRILSRFGRKRHASRGRSARRARIVARRCGKCQTPDARDPGSLRHCDAVAVVPTAVRGNADRRLLGAA